jgi:uncharacterized hydrophobic protein (TIGR00271 family)
MSSLRLPTLTLHRFQDRLLLLLGNHVEARSTIVKSMLHRDPKEAMSYWLQLVVSVGIATLGLVVGSTAVVIGAMLVAPLMIPIVALAMGLATGSPFLVLRSSGRILLSVGVTVGGAALITELLPFHELNAEIAALTTPTVLDLLTAAFCALAGVYASLRPGSDTATTAAGTSIGISLVPPLCASGYGLGTLAWSVAGGAALLFLTNLVAIVAVGCVAFVASGFNRVHVATLERDELAVGDDAPIARRLARRLARLFESRTGPALRLLMPFVLLAVIYVPLRRALDEVAWEVSVRKAVREALASEPGRVVESKAQVARHAVEVVVVLLGKASDAEASRLRLSQRIARVAGVKPSIEVLAVPDANAFAGLESTLFTPRPAVRPPPPLGDRMGEASSATRAAVLELWPTAAGEMLSVMTEAGADGPMRLKVVHFGGRLDPSTQETLVKALESKLERKVELGDVPISPDIVTRREGDLRFIAEVVSLAHASRLAPDTTLCLARPDAVEGNTGSVRGGAELPGALDRALDDQPNLVTQLGEDFTARVVRGACPRQSDEREKPAVTPVEASSGSPPTSP